MTDRQLWLLAGGNGAGKSTFYRTRLQPYGVEFVNADLIERTMDPGAGDLSYQAAARARERFAELISLGRSFCYETVFSHASKLDMLLQAKAAGYHVNLVIIHLARIELNVARVIQRVSEGGHNVPSHKIESRVPRALSLLREAVHAADQSLLLDNSDDTNPFIVVARLTAGVLDAESANRSQMPDWARELVGDSEPPLLD